MEVASRELCEELDGLSGWTVGQHDKFWKKLASGHWEVQTGFGDFPAYSLGFLLRKLPDTIHIPGKYGFLHMIRSFTKGIESNEAAKNAYRYFYAHHTPDGVMHALEGFDVHADTPEDALCGLAIELHKQGILNPQESK